MIRTGFAQRGARLLAFYRDREYFRRLFTIALPIVLQQFIMTSLNMVNVMMIGQLGETRVAAAGLANQIFFLLTLLLFGINSGAAIFTAQLWGKQDIHNIHRVTSLALKLALLAGSIFFTIGVVFPQVALGVYSADPVVIEQGAIYLGIFGWAFLFTPISFTFATVLRSIGDVKTPLYVSATALSLNAFLSYVLIFGAFGLPALGLKGAAFGALISRLVECAGMLLLTYARRSPAAISLAQLWDFDPAFSWRVLKPIIPVAFNELFWSLGITTYNIVYARISTEAIAAMNIAQTIDNLALVIFMGIGHATAVLVGNWIGNGDNEQAFRYSGRSLTLTALGAVLTGMLIIASSNIFLGYYKVSPQVIEYARNILIIMSSFLWLRVMNLVLFIGVLRSGGDTRFAFVLDAGFIWGIGVPLALLGAFVLEFPVHIVYLMVMGDEISKWVVGLRRYFSRKWIHNLTGTV